MPRKHSTAGYHDRLFGVVGENVTFQFEFLNGVSGTLANGVTWARATNNDPVIDGLNGDQRVESNSLITFTFSGPVNFQMSNTTDAALGNPLMWTHSNVNPPPSVASGPFNRMDANGTSMVYTPASVDFQIDIQSTQTAWAGMPQSSGNRAQDDWGTLVASGATVVTIQSVDNDAYNVAVQPV